ncbi:putative polygalacturonate 4-alpha-galacturonosyltransferase [Helianthus annuus]|uniref:Polygalacturonate 4-alpha-galacturonosyltransferase n=1 Tax=Helianthus annuus TaxID=4232 RepID=A0A9K3ELD9_HELAN|nr:putative polygalacturonate 4-alpha-galacturonosyltransferase [Helianthus annuus]
MSVHLTKRTKFLVRVRLSNKGTDTNELPTEWFTSCSLNIWFVCSPIVTYTKLRDKRRENRAADLVKNDNNVIIKLENAAIERSKSVDSAVLGKYSIWRKENDNENIDTTIRLVRDQMIMARVYMSIATMKNKTQLAHELQSQLKESQRALGDATADADLNHRCLLLQG